MREIDIDELRQIQLSILQYVHDFCEKNSIKYYLYYGSLLGAVRHDGYIPWDDDIDIAMCRDDYDRFINTFNRENNGYFAHALYADDSFCLQFCKIAKLNTSIKEDTDYGSKNIGINIDLFPLDSLPSSINPLYEKLFYYLSSVLYAKLLPLRFVHGSFKQIFATVLYKALFFFISPRQIALMHQKIAAHWNLVDGSDCIADCLVGAHGVFPIFNSELFKPVLHKFEGREFYIPCGYDSILRGYYGDYSVLPAPEFRVFKHGFTAWVE